MVITKLNTKFNYTTPKSPRKIEYIVIHYTASNGASAAAEAKYFLSDGRGASAHYFVGFDGEIFQSVEDKDIAWHCGAKVYRHPKCRNTNSIGIEMCCKTKGDATRPDNNWYFIEDTVKATIELTKELMSRYEIPAENVIRHYDVTGKVCPAPYVYNNGAFTWGDFKSKLTSEEVVTVENDNAAIIWRFLSNKGLNDYAVAGVMGNLYSESGLNPKNLQNSFEKKLGMNDETYTAAVNTDAYSKESFVNDGAGYGLAQWTFSTRKKALYEFTRDREMSIGDLYTQLEFLWNEFTDRVRMLAELAASTSVLEASNIILHQFEKPKDQSSSVEKKRAKFGQIYYDKFAKEASKPMTAEDVKEVVKDEEPIKKEEKVEKVEEVKVEEPVKKEEPKEFKVRVEIPDLNIRKGPGTNFDKIGKFTGKGVFTIVEEKDGWGKLKSGAGWIKLSFAKRI
jgi:N-acetylmuramoyl-L-alanine amidase CwlA